MAIEDEIINIADIDKGTDILKDDQLIIETNNGTKLLAFKDLIINEEQITFADKLVQRSGDLTSADTYVDTVTGFNILTTNTTPGHVTTYSDISGTIELGRFNYDGIAMYASLSSEYTRYNTRIKDLDLRVTQMETKVRDAGVSLTPSTSAVNFKVSNITQLEVNTADATKYWLEFDNINLNPTDTHAGVTFQSAEGTPFKLIYPSSQFTAGWYLFTGTLLPQFKNDDKGLKPDDKVELYIKTSAGAVTIVPGQKEFARGSRAQTVSFNTVEYISPGDQIYLKSNARYDFLAGSQFSGVRIVS